MPTVPPPPNTMPRRREAMASRYDSARLRSANAYRPKRQIAASHRFGSGGAVVGGGAAEAGAGAGAGAGCDGGGGGGGGGAGGGATRWAATRWPVTTMRWLFSCLGWQAKSVIVASGVGLAIQVSLGVTMKVWVTA